MINKLRSLSITLKLIILVLGLQFATIASLAYLNEKNLVEKEYRQIDEKLRLVGYAVNEFVLHDYHDQILDKHSISEKEYFEVMLKLSAYVNKADVEYVYSFVKRKEEVLFTSTSVTEKDFKIGKYEDFFEKYDKATAKLLNTFEGKDVVYEDAPDDHGNFRSIFIPVTNKYGETYVVGVDITRESIDQIIANTRENILMISLVIFIISSIVSGLLVNTLVRRIPAIKAGLLEFFDYLNSKRRTVNPINMGGGDELSQMAMLINDNVKLIAVNIDKDNELIDEIASISSQVKKGSFSLRIEHEGNNPALNEVKEIMNDVLIDMQYVMLDILKVLKEFSKQNYTCKLDEYTLDGEMAELVEQMNVFGKNISDYMLNTAYDALNLEKDSRFLYDYMQGLLHKINAYLKEVNGMKEILVDLKKNDVLIQEGYEKIKDEREYAFDVLAKLNEAVKQGTKLQDRELLANQIKITELISDCEQSLNLICKSNEEGHLLKANAQKSLDTLVNDFERFEMQVKEGKSSVDQTQKVSHNLSELSKRMREYIDKSEFSGKENITNLMNFTER